MKWDQIGSRSCSRQLALFLTIVSISTLHFYSSDCVTSEHLSYSSLLIEKYCSYNHDQMIDQLALTEHAQPGLWLCRIKLRGHPLG